MHEVFYYFFFFVYAKNVKCKNEGAFRRKVMTLTERVFPQEFAHGNSNMSINPSFSTSLSSTFYQHHVVIHAVYFTVN